jgi:hypothetical protein
VFRPNLDQLRHLEQFPGEEAVPLRDNCPPHTLAASHDSRLSATRYLVVWSPETKGHISITLRR